MTDYGTDERCDCCGETSDDCEPCEGCGGCTTCLFCSGPPDDNICRSCSGEEPITGDDLRQLVAEAKP